MNAGNPGESASTGATDLVGGFKGLVVWVLPTVLLLVAADNRWPYLVVVWPALLTLMGVACVVNARRCRRVHCFATGPFFLLLAVLSLLYGIHALPLGAQGWQWLGGTLLIGSVVLCCVPEWLFGKYLAR